MPSPHADIVVSRATEQTGAGTGFCFGYAGMIPWTEMAVGRGTIRAVNLKTNIALQH